MSDSEDPIDPLDEGGDDLFGDEGEEDVAPSKERVLDDDDLASDPEGDTYAHYRNDDEEQPQQETKDKVVMAVQTYRHRTPKPKDGALRLLRVPKFLKIIPQEYDPDTFQPSEFDLENAKAENPKHVARVRRDHGTGELRSNTNVYRWSDGSVTISVGGEHYEVQKKALAPGPDQPYNEIHDGHYYAAAAELTSNLLMTVGHITEQFNVRPNITVGDDALTKLAERMDQASKPAQGGGDMIIKTTRDPELQKKQAEMAEKERIKAQRRRENAAAKMDGGYGRRPGGGLSIGDLEGGRRGVGAGRKRGAPGSTKPKRRRPEYDSDDDLPQGVHRRGDDYDLDDGFLVGSDDEEMESGADDDEELLDDEEEAPRSKRQRTTEADEDAEGDDLEPMEASGRSRRRHVIDDDEE